MPHVMEKPIGVIEEIDGRVQKTATSGKKALLEPPAGAGWEPLARKMGFQVGKSPAMRRLVETAYKIAKKNINVLIQGETGTGKEILARFIHAASHRSRQVFVPLNCGALPKGVMETELFGHERGAFTGAVKMRRGLFEMAHRGTIFLDEIGEAGPAIQVKLLRVLETGEFLRVGGEKPVKIDVRVIAATNVDLRLALRNGTFREDLFYRLEGVRLEIPPLRERVEDIPVLAEFFARKINPALLISPEAMRLLCNYSWPGNIRELSNIIQNAAALCEGNIILPEHLGARILGGEPAGRKTRRSSYSGKTAEDTGCTGGRGDGCPGTAPPGKVFHAFLDFPNQIALEGMSCEKLADLLIHVRRQEKKILHVMRARGSDLAPLLSLEEAEIHAITEALDYHQGVIIKAARSLGIGRNTLARKIKKYNIKVEGLD